MTQAFLVSIQEDICYAVCRPGKEFTKGMLLIGTDPHINEPFLFKIIGFTYISDINLDSQIVQNCLYLIEKQLKDKSDNYNKYSSDSSKLLVLECLIIGQIKDGILKPFSSFPAQFTVLEPPGQENLDFLPRMTGNIPIGDFKNGNSRINLPFFIDTANLPLNLAVIGQKGYHKRSLISLLLKASFLQENLALLILDWDGKFMEKILNESDLVSSTPKNKLFTIYSNQQINLRLNPIKFSIMELDLLDVCSSFNLSKSVQDDARIIFNKYRRQWLMQLGSKDPHKLIKDIGVEVNPGNINHLINFGQEVNSFDSIKGEIEKSITQNLLSIIDSGNSVLFDLSTFSQTEKLFISNFLGRIIFEKRKNMEQNSYPKTLIISSESDRFFPDEDQTAQSIFLKILKYGKRLGIGFVALSARPEKFDPLAWEYFDFSLFFNFQSWMIPDEIINPYFFGDILFEDLDLLELDEALLLIPDFSIPIKLALFKPEEIYKNKEIK